MRERVRERRLSLSLGTHRPSASSGSSGVSVGEDGEDGEGGGDVAAAAGGGAGSAAARTAPCAGGHIYRSGNREVGGGGEIISVYCARRCKLLYGDK